MNSLLLAYLDPGSGSALMGAVFALCGAFLYSVKSLFFRYVLGKKIATIKPHEGIVIFSEGKNYWGTFRPIVEELLRREMDFSYYTMDVKDPALHIDSPHMFTRLYDKDKITSFRKLSLIKAKVLLATTPNIGTPGYPLARPKNVDRMVHVFHDPLGDVSTYMKGSLDHYDDVLLPSSFSEGPIRALEQKRGLNKKTMHLCGLPYLDGYVARRNSLAESEHSGAKTVIVASSWGAKGILRAYGIDYVKDLIAAGFHVIVRPHPQSYNSEREFIMKLEKKAKSWGAEWDCDPDGLPSLSRADVMISDTSGVRFDYAYLFARPVISMKIAKTTSESLEAADVGENWVDRVAAEIGLELDDAGKIVDAVKKSLSGTEKDIAAWRDAHCANFGCAAKAIVDEMAKMEAL